MGARQVRKSFAEVRNSFAKDTKTIELVCQFSNTECKRINFAARDTHREGSKSTMKCRALGRARKTTFGPPAAGGFPQTPRNLVGPKVGPNLLVPQFSTKRHSENNLTDNFVPEDCFRVPGHVSVHGGLKTQVSFVPRRLMLLV